MIKIERILCPTDLSTESDEALRYAVALARACEARLFLLYCSDATSNGDEKNAKTNGRLTNLFIESLAPHLGLAELSELRWEGLVRKNVEDVGKAIVYEARQQKIDLVVMRSRRRPRAAALLGSTAETVSRSAPCPVLVTHPREREWVGLTTGEIDLRRILVAYNFSRDSELAWDFGISLAQEYEAEVHLLNVLDEQAKGEPELAWAGPTDESTYKFVERRLQQACPNDLFPERDVVTAVGCGKPADEVLAYAEEHEIDLICLGASESNWAVGKLLGSTTDRVLRKAHCPVLIARPVVRLS